jgi:hypothetical protein
MNTFARTSLPLVLLAAMAGCKSNNIKTSDDDYISQVVGSQGATLSLDDGASLFIPPNSITDEREVRLGRVGSGYPAFNGAVATSAVYAIDPMDVTFKIAAQLAAPGTQGTLFFAAPGSQWMDLHGAPDSKGHIVATSIQAGFFAAVQSSTEMGGTKDPMVAPGSGGGPNTDITKGGTTDGTLVRSDVPQQTPDGAVFGETHLFFSQDVVDQFGQMSIVLKAMPLGSMDPVVDVATFGSRTGHAQVVPCGEYAYWIEQQEPMGGPPPPAKLNRVKPGGAVETVATGMMNNTVSARAGSVFFVDSNSSLALYDSATSMLDPTMYGSNLAMAPSNVGIATRSADHVFFLTGGGTSPYGVWGGLVGSPSANTGITFPGGANLLAMGASGGNFIIVTSAGTQANVLSYDSSSPGNPKTLASFSAEVTTPGGIQIEGDDLFTTVMNSDHTSSDLIKISLIDGMQTKVGSLGQANGAQIGVNSQYVYAVTPDNTGAPNASSALYQWAR